jgi:hypothetical protein
MHSLETSLIGNKILQKSTMVTTNIEWFLLQQKKLNKDSWAVIL